MKPSNRFDFLSGSFRKSIFCLLGAFLSSPLYSGPVEQVLFKEDFERLAFGRPMKSFTWEGFPAAEEEGKNNGIVAPELGAAEKGKKNKVLRMFAPPGGGMALEERPNFMRTIDVPEAGHSMRLLLEFDYRNLGTAGAWCQLGLREKEGGSSVGIFFNGASSVGNGGIRIGKSRTFPVGKSGELRNLAVETWYHVSAEINQGEQSMQVTVVRQDTGESYTTGPVTYIPEGDGRLNELVFNFEKTSEKILKANYRFELDNIKISLLPD